MVLCRTHQIKEGVIGEIPVKKKKKEKKGWVVDETL